MSDTSVILFGRGAAISLPEVNAATRRPSAPFRLERYWRVVSSPIVSAGHGLRGHLYSGIAARIGYHAETLEDLSDDELRRKAWAAGAELRAKGGSRAYAKAAAPVVEAVRRETGFRLNPRQLQGGLAIWSGTIAEMETGEGKTLTAVVPAAVAALSGNHVHVVTVNDYLAARDLDITAPIYRRMGLSTGLVGRTVEEPARRAAYDCAITYGSNSELAFDHLRDRTEAAGRSPRALSRAAILSATDDGGRRRSRIPALDFVIVDETDSVLVDEARTPLILSGEAPSIYQLETCQTALDIAVSLARDKDFRLEAERRQIRLTRRGRRVLEDVLTNAGSESTNRWSSPLFREEIVRQALAALHLYERDRDYVVRDDKVMIIDEYTGRVFEDRSWSQGQHQLIEVKEGLDPTPDRAAIGRMTYQNLFARYRIVGGMTGTISEAAGEIWRIYGLRTTRVPTFRPARRVVRADRIFSDEATRDQALIKRIQVLCAARAPVLIGARTVASSERLAGLLREEGLEVSLLNAESEAAEAEIVAQAGQAGRITIATNMAGRGTDIRLDDEALAAGGLHVILTERHDSRRIDRQFEGRSARQGQPGVCEAYLSMEDRLLSPNRLTRLLAGAVRLARVIPSLRGYVLRRSQKHLESMHGRARWRLYLSEGSLDRTLAVTGERE